MNPFRLLIFALGSLLFCATAAQAQLQLSAPTYFNHLKLPGGTALGSVNPVPASQFSSVGVSSGSAGPRNQAVPTAEPRFAEGTTNGSTSIKLTSARVGNAFATGVPRYYLGDFITPPLVQADNITPAPAGYWRAKPVRDTETFTGTLRDVTTLGTLTNPVWNKTPAQEAFYYSAHADAVFASQPGAVEIWWVTAIPQGGEWKFKNEKFNVSSATQREVRTIYWTEKSFNGPRVDIPGGRIERVNPVFSTAFPSVVVDEYVPVGQVINPDPNGQPAEEKRTLWFDQIGGSAQIAAYNLEGRVLVEYLGQEIAPNRHQFLGADVVQVAPRAAHGGDDPSGPSRAAA